MTDEERDAHLRQALRHAPDADVRPPPALSALILTEAQAKTRGPSPARPVSRSAWASVWDWLARPSVATGFAGVLAATLVGLMWWDQPMDEALPRHPPPAAAPAQPTPPIAAAAPPTATPAPAAEAARAAAPLATQRNADARTDRANATGKRKKEERSAVAAEPVAKPVVPVPPAPAPAPAAAAAAAPSPVPAEAESTDKRMSPAPHAREEVAAAAPPAAAPPPAPSVAANDSGAAGASVGSLAKSRVADEFSRTRAMTPATEATPSRRSGVPANLGELRQSRAEAAPTLAQLGSAIAAEPARWTWHRDGDRPQAMNDAVRNWLARLDADAGDRWQAVDATVLRPGGEIRLLHDGHVRHGFRLTEGGVLWQRPQGGWQRVTLPATSLSALETSVP